MARCIAFPPPEYVQNGVRGAALSELIKLRREEREASEKRRKKEKRRRKKGKEEELEEGEIRERKSTHKHKKVKKYGGAGDSDQMNGESENQLLERSSLTEELQLPISDSLYESSDSTRNINLKHHCCSFARTNFLVQDKPELAPAFVSSEACLQCVESQYRELTVNWVPPPFQIEHHEFDDQEWLFERKFLRSNMTEICKACNDDLVHGHGRSSLYPCAQYLPQADICALPYTTLF